MTAESTMNLEDIGFGDKPIAVFIEMPDYDKSAHFLGSVFIRQLYFVLARKATRQQNGRCKNRVKIIADEFGNMPAIEAMENIITVCLGRNISFDLYIQAYAQLNKLYGDKAKDLMKIDVKENEHDFEVFIDLPGFKKENLKLDLTDGYIKCK